MHYSITIQQISPPHNTLSDAGEAADNIIVIGPKTVVGHTNVYEVVNSSLVVDTVYSVLVDFDTLAGNVSSNTTFGKQMFFETTLKVYEHWISFYAIWKQTYTFVAQTVTCINANSHYKNNFLLSVHNVLCRFTLDQRPHSGKDGVF